MPKQKRYTFHYYGEVRYGNNVISSKDGCITDTTIANPEDAAMYVREMAYESVRASYKGEWRTGYHVRLIVFSLIAVRVGGIKPLTE